MTLGVALILALISSSGTFMISESVSGGSCEYIFQIWRPGEDILKRIHHLEVMFANITSVVDHQAVRLQNRLISEMLSSQNVTHRLEKELLEQKLYHVQQEMDLKDFRLVLYDVRTETRKLWQAMNILQASAPGAPPGGTLSVTSSSPEVAKLEGEFVELRRLVGELKNGVGDLRAEWLLIKREVNIIRADNVQVKFQGNDLKTDIVRLKSLIEGLRAQTALVRSRLDELSVFQQSIRKDTETQRSGSDSEREDISRFSNDLLDLRRRSDRLESELLRLTAINDDFRIGVQELLSGKQNVSTESIRRILENMVSLSTGHEDNRKSKEVTIPKDCHDVYTQGYRVSGVYKIQPGSNRQADDVYCEMVNHTGWTVLMRRQDGTVRFTKGWLEYQHGFGSLYGEFWLGNENIHQLSKQKRYRLRVDIWDWEGGRSYAEYDTFSVGSKQTKYKLRVRDYSGNAGDSLSYHDDMAFSTEDSDNDLHMLNCAQTNKGGWWYNSCYSSNLNGLYRTGWYTKSQQTFADGIVWYTLKESEFYSLRKAEMKIRPLYLA